MKHHYTSNNNNNNNNNDQSNDFLSNSSTYVSPHSSSSDNTSSSYNNNYNNIIKRCRCRCNLSIGQILKGVGFICTFTYFAFAVAAFVMSIINYKTLHAKWSENNWKHLSYLSIWASSILMGISFIGFINYLVCVRFKLFLIIYLVLSFCSLVFTWTIGITASVGAVVHNKINGMLHCDTELEGILEMWDNIDRYLQFADSLHCSPQCPCYMTDATRKKFQTNSKALEMYNIWEVYTKNYGDNGRDKTYEFSLDDCPQDIKDEIVTRYIEDKSSLGKWIKPEVFATYWSRIEEKFNCAGWCVTTYVDKYSMQEKTMYKYVFSDINRGVVTNLGCLHQIVDWIPVYVGWFAGCIVCGAFLQTATFAFNVVLIRGGGNIWVVHRKEEEDGCSSSVDSKDERRYRYHHNGCDDDSSQNPMKKKKEYKKRSIGNKDEERKHKKKKKVGSKSTNEDMKRGNSENKKKKQNKSNINYNNNNSHSNNNNGYDKKKHNHSSNKPNGTEVNMKYKDNNNRKHSKK